MMHLFKKLSLLQNIPVLIFAHVDTLWKFKEMIDFRDEVVQKEKLNMMIYTNEKRKEFKYQSF